MILGKANEYFGIISGASDYFNPTSPRGLVYMNEPVFWEHEGNKAAFARSINTTRQQVNQWINNDFIVVTHNKSIKLYSPRKML